MLEVYDVFDAGIEDLQSCLKDIAIHLPKSSVEERTR